MFKSIVSNTFAQLLAKFVGAGLTLVTTFFIIRLVGLAQYGDLTKILVLVAVGFTAIDFGLNAEGLRSSPTDAAMKKSTQTIIFARLILSVLVVLALNALIYFLPGGYSSQVKSIFWLGSLGIVFQGFYTSCNAWFQYKLSYWSSTLSVVAGSVVSAALTMYYVVRSPTLPHLVFSSMLGYVVMALVSYLCLPPLDSKLWNTKLVVSLLQRSLILGLILIANVIAIKSDTVILGIFKSSGEVGQYGFAYRIFEVILVLPVFVINAIYPLSLKENSSTFKSSIYDKTVKYLAIMSLGISGATWIVAPYLYLVKPELSLSIVVLRLLAFTIPLFYVTAPLMWSLIRQKRDKLVLLIYVCAAALNFTLNFTFIPSFGATAAAINTGVTELFIFLVLYYFSIKK